VVIYDARFYDSSDWDNEVHEDDGYLDDPALYPEVEGVELDSIQTPQAVETATIETEFNNTDNDQFVEIGNGQTVREDNSETATVEFEEPETTINATLGLDGFGTDGNQTPRERFEGQEVDLVDVLIDLSVLNISDVGRTDIEVILDSFEGEISEAGQLTQNDVTLTRSIFPAQELDGQDVILSEDLGFDIS